MSFKTPDQQRRHNRNMRVYQFWLKYGHSHSYRDIARKFHLGSGQHVRWIVQRVRASVGDQHQVPTDTVQE